MKTETIESIIIKISALFLDSEIKSDLKNVMDTCQAHLLDNDNFMLLLDKINKSDTLFSYRK